VSDEVDSQTTETFIEKEQIVGLLLIKFIAVVVVHLYQLQLESANRSHKKLTYVSRLVSQANLSQILRASQPPPASFLSQPTKGLIIRLGGLQIRLYQYSLSWVGGADNPCRKKWLTPDEVRNGVGQIYTVGHKNGVTFIFVIGVT